MSVQPFEEVVTEHGPVVLRVCRALLGPADADDVWSETFLAAMRSYPALRPDSNVRGWLVTIAHHKAVDHLRKVARSPLASAVLPESPVHGGAASDGFTVETDGALRAAVDALPYKQRRAVIYRYLADLPYAEIGALLDCSEVAARRNAADGIARLRRDYERDTEER